MENLKNKIPTRKLSSKTIAILHMISAINKEVTPEFVKEINNYCTEEWKENGRLGGTYSMTVYKDDVNNTIDPILRLQEQI